MKLGGRPSERVRPVFNIVASAGRTSQLSLASMDVEAQRGNGFGPPAVREKPK